MNHVSDPLPVITTDADERMWALFCHLSTLVTWFPLANVILPLIIWMVKKDSSALVNDQGKEALNFQITMMIGYALCFPLMLILIGFPAAAALLVYHVIFSIVAAIKSYEGRAYRYPFAIRLID